MAIIESNFQPDDRGRAIGAWSGLGGVFAAIGPVLGGFLVGAVSWRLVFLINLPLAALTVFVASRHVPESSQPRAGGPLDLRGPVLAVVGLGGVTYSLIEGSARGWTAAATLVPIVAGALLLVAFFVKEGRRRDPLLLLSIFRSRVFAGANETTFAIYAALGTVLFLGVLELQQVLHYSALLAGVALMPLTIVMLALSSRSGKLATTIGHRIPMTIGPLVAGGGMALFARIGAGTSYVTTVLPAGIVLGLGLALTVPALTTTALGAVSSDRAGIASAVNNYVARLASLAAVAVVPALAGISTTGSTVGAAAFFSGYRVAMLMCSGLCVVASAVSFATIREPRRRDALASGFCCPITGPPARVSPEAH